MEPEFDGSSFKSDIFCALGRVEDSIDAEHTARIHSGESPKALDKELGELKRAIKSEGPKAYWRREIENAKKRNDIYEQACDYTQFGDIKAAFGCMNEAVKEHNEWLTFMIMTEWRLDPLRSDPRFHEILKTMHLE